MTHTAELYDLDGTLTTPSFDLPEGSIYLDESAKFLIERIPALGGSGQVAKLSATLRATIDADVFPFRAQAKYWAEFPTTQGQLAPICPAVDHYLLTQHGIRIHLSKILQDAPAGNLLAAQIRTFLESGPWTSEMYSYASKESAPHAYMDDDARDLLDDRLAKKRVVAIFTNSLSQKARDIATKAGFGKVLVDDKLVPGKLGIIANGRKAMIDTAWSQTSDGVPSRFGNTLDVTKFFGEPITVDLRRRLFHERLVEIVRASGINNLIMFGDIPCLDHLPFMNWGEFQPQVGMRITPMSAPEEIAIVRELLASPAEENLSTLASKFE